jgi:phosphatidylserine decarboxylase
MKIPLTKFGWPQVVVIPALILSAMVVIALLTDAVLPIWIVIVIEILFSVFLVWSISFFRDPERQSPSDDSLLLAPADGRITDIETTNENSFIQGPALRISIFLSIFDIHINRSPCNANVKMITHKEGKHRNAMSSKSGRENEFNDLCLVRINQPQDRLIIRQVSGAIARRIVCNAKIGQKLNRGEKFGMIKFGSRTELYVPIGENVKCLVNIGDKVKAGLTPLAMYEMKVHPKQELPKMVVDTTQKTL